MTVTIHKENRENDEKVLRGIAYLPKPSSDDYRNKMCRLDLHLPASSAPFPILIYFHGGGLTNGTCGGPTEHVKQGVGIVAVGYRLYPQAKHPDHLNDAAAAVSWVFRNIHHYGGDPSKIFIGGYSAGAYLAAMLALDTRLLNAVDVDADDLAGALLQSGQMITHFAVRKQMGYGPEQGVCDENSPMYHIRKTPFPILLQCGDNDYPSRREENHLFASMMTRWAKQENHMIECREYTGTHSTLADNNDFKHDAAAFLNNSISLAGHN